MMVNMSQADKSNHLLKLDINRSKDSAQDWTSATVKLLKIYRDYKYHKFFL